MATSLKKPNFTATRFLQEVKSVYKWAHDGKFIYSDSQTLPPCNDRRISCDRIVSRALWNLGFTDQRKGGEVVGTMPTYLVNHGFVKITNKANLQPGDIVIVDDGGKSKAPQWTWHVFVINTYNAKTGACTKYDMGSQQRIQSAQPFSTTLLEWGASKRFWAAFRDPYINNISGTYVIESAVDRNFALDIKGAGVNDRVNLQLYKKNGTQAQKFKLVHVKDGFYNIVNIKSNKVLDVEKAKVANKTNIQQYKPNGTNAQLWKPVKNSNGSYTFVSKLNKQYVMDLSSGKALKSQNIQLYKKNGTPAQEWFLFKTK